VRSTLDLAPDNRLPRALARAAEPVFDGLDGVVRVRHLDVRLELGDALDGFAERLADRIAGLLRAALLSDSGDEVLTWADHDHYVADYLAGRLGLVQLPSWPFEDLAVLDHLPAERATAEVVSHRPAVLARLVQGRSPSLGPEAVVAGWPVSAQAALAVALVVDREPPTAAEVAAAAVLLHGLPTPVVDRPADEVVAAAALVLALRALASAGATVSVPAVVVVALSALAATAPGAAGHVTRSALVPASETDPVARAVARACALAGHLAAPSRPEGSGAEVEQRRTHRDENRPADTAKPSRTPYAGLALLMPSVLGLGASDLLGPTRLAQVVWQTLLDDDREAVAHDPAIAQLFPVDPKEVDQMWVQPDPPSDLVDRLCEAARPTYSAAPRGERWSALLLADLACRLPGLGASSWGYLRHQFLERPGTVETETDRVTVRLEPVPLGVVLRMAGHGTAPQRLPHVGDRWLVLDLAGESG
jgi:hypothetical protein